VTEKTNGNERGSLVDCDTENNGNERSRDL